MTLQAGAHAWQSRETALRDLLDGPPFGTAGDGLIAHALRLADVLRRCAHGDDPTFELADVDTRLTSATIQTLEALAAHLRAGDTAAVGDALTTQAAAVTAVLRQCVHSDPFSPVDMGDVDATLARDAAGALEHLISLITVLHASPTPGSNGPTGDRPHREAASRREHM